MKSGDRGQEEERSGEAPEKKPPRRPFDSFRENVEAIVVAVVLALIIRHFSVEAFEIPTGSMASTLFGIHTWVRCPDCDTDFNMSIQTDQETGQVTVSHKKALVYWGACPQCKLPHHRTVHDDQEPRAGLAVRPGDAFVCPFDQARWTGKETDFGEEDVFPETVIGTITCPICWFDFLEVVPNDWWHRTGGHKILVNKFAYKVGRPERWDVIVFQFDRETNYIKRLIGKPGEKLEIKAGDVFINDLIERKSKRPEIQEVLWTKIADLDIPERGFQKTPAWKEVFPSGSGVPAGSFSWNAPERKWSVNTGAPGGKTAALRYQRPIENYYSYNVIYRKSHGLYRMDQVGDKKVAFEVKFPRGGKGWIGAELQKGQFCFQFRLPVGKPDTASPATLRRLSPIPDSPVGVGGGYLADREALPPPDGKGWPSAPVALRPEKDVTRVEFENVDDRVAARIDGEEVLSLEYDSQGELVNGPSDNGLFLLAGGGVECNLGSIRVYRDIYYTGNEMRMAFAANGKAVTLKSVESGGDENEYFPCGDNSPASFDGRYWGPVPERNMMGQAFLVFWPLWPTNWQFKIIR
jgi:signal peptidase I